MKKKNNNSGNEFIFPREIMTMEAFIQVAKAVLLDAYPDCKIEINDINDGMGHNIMLSIAGPDSNIVQTIPLGGFFKEYTSGKSLPEVCSDIVGTYKEGHQQEGFFMESLHDYARAESSICYKLENLTKIQKHPVPIPYVPFLDMAVVFYFPIREGGWFSTLTVTDSLMRKAWGISDVGELYSSAHRNTCRLFPARMESMGSLMDSLLPEQEAPDADVPLPMFVISNSYRLCGASVILYDGLLKASADALNDDLYLIPSSVHEMLLLPASTCDRHEYLKAMVAHVNRTELDADDVLSDSIYYYDRKTDKLKII